MDELYTVQLTKDEIDHILTSFDMFGTATLRKDGVALEDSINEKLTLALQRKDTQSFNMEENSNDYTLEDEVYPDGEEE